MSNKNLIHFRKIFITLFREVTNIDCNPYYRWMGFNNMYSFLKDFIEYLSMDKSLIRKTQVEILLDEFIFLYDHDIVFASRYKNHSLEILKSIKDIRKNSLLEQNFLRIKRDLEIIFNSLKFNDNYFRTLQWILANYLIEDRYDSSLEPSNEKDLKKLKRLFFILLSILEDEKWLSRKYLDFIRATKLDERMVDITDSLIFERKYNSLLTLLFKDRSEYIVYFKIKISDIQANKKKINLSEFKEILTKISVSVVDDIEKEFSEVKIKEDFLKSLDFFKNVKDEDKDNIVFIKITAMWLDIYSIQKEAKEKITRLLDTFLFEFNAFSFKISSLSVVLDHENRSFIVDCTYKEYINRKYWNIKNIERINSFLTDPKYDIELKKGLSNSIKYYSLFLSSDDQEIKLLNLWIALESLFSLWDWNDKWFEKMKTFIPKLMALNLVKNYFDEFQYFILYKEKVESENGIKYKNFLKIKTIISNNNEWKFNNVGIFKFFINWKFDEIKDFIRNEYFIQKYSRLEKIVLKEANSYKFLYEHFKNHERDIKWLLVKIYRYRNYIVHWWKKVDTEKVINELEFLYLSFIEDIFNKLWEEYLQIFNLNEYFIRMNRTYDYYEKGINPRVNEVSLNETWIVLPYIMN